MLCRVGRPASESEEGPRRNSSPSGKSKSRFFGSEQRRRAAVPGGSVIAAGGEAVVTGGCKSNPRYPPNRPDSHSASPPSPRTCPSLPCDECLLAQGSAAVFNLGGRSLRGAVQGLLKHHAGPICRYYPCLTTACTLV